MGGSIPSVRHVCTGVRTKPRLRAMRRARRWIERERRDRPWMTCRTQCNNSESRGGMKVIPLSSFFFQSDKKGVALVVWVGDRGIHEQVREEDGREVGLASVHLHHKGRRSVQNCHWNGSQANGSSKRCKGSGTLENFNKGRSYRKILRKPFCACTDVWNHNFPLSKQTSTSLRGEVCKISKHSGEFGPLSFQATQKRCIDHNVELPSRICMGQVVEMV